MIHKDMALIDLTHALSPQTPSWTGKCGFDQEIKLDYSTSGFRVQKLKMHAGIGTHMDAPAHCNPGALTIAEIPLEQLIAPCVVIDVTGKSHELYTTSVEDIELFESVYGCIEPGSFVIIYTGWSRHWEDPVRYRNNHLFPSVSKEAAEFLLTRDIVGIGIDTLSPDRPEDGFPVHEAVLGAGKYIIENIANAERMPFKQSYSIALPIKTNDGTEAPVRLIGIVNTDENDGIMAKVFGACLFGGA